MKDFDNTGTHKPKSNGFLRKLLLSAHLLGAGLIGSVALPAVAEEEDSKWNPLADFQGIVAPSITYEDLPYRGVDTQVDPSLLIMGRIDKLFIEGNRVGYRLARTDYGALSAIGQIRTHQHIPENDILPERDKAIEVGLQLAKPINDTWTAQFTFFKDISDTHNGSEFEVGVYRRDFWQNFRLLTLFALQQQTKSLTGYYADFEDYKADADLNAEVEFIGIYEINEDWNISAVYRHYLHGSNFDDSPITNGNQSKRFTLGVGLSF